MIRTPDPTKMKRGPKRFLVYFVGDVLQGVGHRGPLALIPWRAGACAAGGVVIGLRAQLVSSDSGIMLYGALLTFSAILFAVCWGGFGRIYDILGERGFGDWLREK